MGIFKETKEVTRVMGADCSTQSFAFAIFNGDKLESWGEIKFNGNNVFERLADGQSKVRAMKDILNVDKVVIESAVFVQNKKTVILLAYAFGAIIAALINSGCIVVEANPIAWQRFIGNKALTKIEKQAIMDENPGKSKSWYSNKNRDFRKQRTRKWVEQEFGVDIDNDNVTDAVGLGYYGVNN